MPAWISGGELAAFLLGCVAGWVAAIVLMLAFDDRPLPKSKDDPRERWPRT